SRSHSAVGRNDHYAEPADRRPPRHSSARVGAKSPFVQVPFPLLQPTKKLGGSRQYCILPLVSESHCCPEQMPERRIPMPQQDRLAGKARSQSSHLCTCRFHKGPADTKNRFSLPAKRTW